MLKSQILNTGQFILSVMLGIVIVWSNLVASSVVASTKLIKSRLLQNLLYSTDLRYTFASKFVNIWDIFKDLKLKHLQGAQIKSENAKSWAITRKVIKKQFRFFFLFKIKTS
jgi:hypothetical protein